MQTPPSSVTRRDFLKAGGAALAAAALPSGAQEPAAGTTVKKRNLRKGIMWGCVPGGKMTLRDKFKMVADAGFAGIEIDSGLDQAEVLKARDESGLALPTVVCSTHWRLSLTDPNPAVRQQGYEGLVTALRDAKAYGADTILLVPGIVKQEVPYDRAYKLSQEAIRNAIPLAAELGVKIGVENVWNHFLLSPMEAARYVDEFNSPAVSWHFDIGNVINTGWPEHWIHILGPRIRKLHLKEFSRKERDEHGLWKGFQVEYLQGDVNWAGVMAALDDIGYQGWATAEPAWQPPNAGPAERMRQVSSLLDKIFAL